MTLDRERLIDAMPVYLRRAFVRSVEAASTGGWMVTATVADDPVACLYSGAFEAELKLKGADLVGVPVVVEMLEGQPVIAHSIAGGWDDAS